MAQSQHDGLRLVGRGSRLDTVIPVSPSDIEPFDELSTLRQLVAGAAHGLRNMVTGVMSHAHLILERPDVPPEVAALAREIVDASRRGAHLAQSLVRLGRQRPRCVAALDLCRLVRDFAGVLHMAVGSRATLHLKADVRSALALVDPADIERVLSTSCSTRETRCCRTVASCRYPCSIPPCPVPVAKPPRLSSSKSVTPARGRTRSPCAGCSSRSTPPRATLGLGLDSPSFNSLSAPAEDSWRSRAASGTAPLCGSVCRLRTKAGRQVGRWLVDQRVDRRSRVH